MSKAGRIAALVLSVLLGAGSIVGEASAASSSRPPQDLKKVGDHWTPWDPPPAADGDYIIQSGDTLWDLAAQWLGDPYLWPQIWEQNRYILDSHWIYPGDPLKVPGRPIVVPAEGPPPSEDQGDTGAGQATGPTPSAPSLVPAGDATDLYCSGFIAPERTPSDLWVTGREMERIHVADGDVIYMNKGRSQGVGAGAEYAVVREVREVLHPETGEVLGTFVRRLGKVRVLAAQPDTAVAVIVTSCEDIRDSDELIPWRDLPMPMLASLPVFERYQLEPTGGDQGWVVLTQDELQATGEGNVLYVDMGADAGLEPGEVVHLYRESGDGLPRKMLGQAVILSTEAETSLAKITVSVREVALGDRVERLP